MIVIPIAGKSKRFKDAGIPMPKWSLVVDGMTVLDKSINSIKPSLRESETVLLVINTGDEVFLNPILDKHKEIQIMICALSADTMGQADTVRQALIEYPHNPKERLVIWCGDSAFNPAALNFREASGNYLAVAKLAGDHWSFVESDNLIARRLVEKIRISELASIGLYGFNSVEELLNLDFPKILQDNTEMYVAPLYNQLIAQGGQIRIIELDKEDFYPFGTPEEFFTTCYNLGWASS